MKALSVLLIAMFSTQAFAEQCYELSADGKTWESQPFKLCYQTDPTGTAEFQFTLSKAQKTVAVYYLNSIPSGGALAFGIDAGTGSMFEDTLTIAIGFGEVVMNGRTYFYRE